MATTKHFRKRDAILTYLKGTTEHPSAEMVYASLKPQIPDLSLGTVYRNLNLFKEQGLAITVGTVKGVERFDGNTHPHVHFFCMECGAVMDLPQMKVPEQLVSTAAGQIGGTAEQCQMSFTGLCRDCLQNHNNKVESA